MRLARAGLGDIDYWMGLPFSELAKTMNELVTQLQEEHVAAEQAAKRR